VGVKPTFKLEKKTERTTAVTRDLGFGHQLKVGFVF
jgi:hypothetical protein